MSIPDRFDSNTLRNAYQHGYDHASGIARRVVPLLGEAVDIAAFGETSLTGADRIVTPENIRAVHAARCYEAEDNSRSFTPFEVTARAFNVMSNANELWDAFDIGVNDAIDSDIAAFTDRDYGIV